jgi:flagellar hook protein FlgE
MIDFSTPLAGMNAAETSLNRTATNIANYGASPLNSEQNSAQNSPQSTSGGDTVDLSTDVVSMIEARNNFAANVKTVQTEDQMTQSLLNIFG